MPSPLNICAVGVRGSNIVVEWPTRLEMTKDQALNLAAWITVLVNDDEKFLTLVEEIKT